MYLFLKFIIETVWSFLNKNLPLITLATFNASVGLYVPNQYFALFLVWCFISGFLLSFFFRLKNDVNRSRDERSKQDV